MPSKNIVILDGTASADKDLLPILDALSHVLQAEDSQILTFPLREMKLAHCIGCFGCWVKTPGICVEADAGREIAKAIVRSDVTVLFTPVTFGGYSPELKKMVDRLIPIASPFFEFDHDELHHPPRYSKRPRLLVVGVQRIPNEAEAHIFKTLAGRNAINLHPASYAAEVVLASEDISVLQGRFEALMTRSDSLPFGDAAGSLMPAPVIPDITLKPDCVRRALLIVGSPKVNEASASGALGGFLLDRIQKQGWETESLTLRANLNRPEGAAELLSAVERAGLILFVFPLYVDALPYLVTKAMTVIASHRTAENNTATQRVVAIVNSGFPETHQNSLAMAICRRVYRAKRSHVGRWSRLRSRWNDRCPASHTGEASRTARWKCNHSVGDDRRRSGRGPACTSRSREDHDQEPHSRCDLSQTVRIHGWYELQKIS